MTVERVTDDLGGAAANGDLAVERTRFDDEPDLFGSLEPIVQEHREHHDAINSLYRFQTGWAPDTLDTYSDIVDDQVDDEAVAAIGRYAPQIVAYGELEDQSDFE